MSILESGYLLPHARPVFSRPCPSLSSSLRPLSVQGGIPAGRDGAKCTRDAKESNSATPRCPWIPASAQKGQLRPCPPATCFHTCLRLPVLPLVRPPHLSLRDCASWRAERIKDSVNSFQTRGQLPRRKGVWLPLSDSPVHLEVNMLPGPHSYAFRVALSQVRK